MSTSCERRVLPRLRSFIGSKLGVFSGYMCSRSSIFTGEKKGASKDSKMFSKLWSHENMFPPPASQCYTHIYHHWRILLLSGGLAASQPRSLDGDHFPRDQQSRCTRDLLCLQNTICNSVTIISRVETRNWQGVPFLLVALFVLYMPHMFTVYLTRCSLVT